MTWHTADGQHVVTLLRCDFSDVRERARVGLPGRAHPGVPALLSLGGAGAGDGGGWSAGASA